jgi:putative peptidoglycan lipid II flippase
LAPGFDPDAIAQTGHLLRLLAPAVVFLSLSSLTYITLNAYGRFLLPATGDLALKLAPSLCCLALVSEFGTEVLALGFLAGALARLGIHGLGLGAKLSMLALPRASDRRDLVAFGWLVLPLVLGSGFAQLGELAGNHFSSFAGEGGVAAKNYARKIRDVPLEVVSYSLSVVLFPTFAHLIVAGKRAEALRLLARTVRGLALSFAVLGVVVYVLRDSLVSVLLERGAFGSEERASTAYALGMYAPGMIAAAIEGVLVVHFFARKDTRTPVALGILCVALDIVLCASLVRPLGVGGVALALTITKAVKVVALSALLHRRERCVAWRAVLCSAGRILLAAAVSGLTMRYAQLAWSPDPADAAAVPELAWLGAVGSLGALTFLATILAVGGEDRALLIDLARSLPRHAGHKGHGDVEP